MTDRTIDKKDKKPSVGELIGELIGDMVTKEIDKIHEEYENSISSIEKHAREVTSEVEDKMRSILSQMAVYSCYNCGKDLISGKDAIYTNNTGHKFCSHKCIDENLNETK